MDKVGEATFDLGKRRDEFASASDNGKLHQPKMEAKQSVNGVRIVRAAGRKDRHSKVCTARGTRDRRVRLSPKTAILFYDVQDRLGYDRPSKAIDWLMTEAKAAIDALDDPPAADYNQSTATNAGSPNCKAVQERSNDDNPISGFGFFDGGGAPPPLSRQEAGGDYQEQSLSAPPTPLELFDANSEIVRLQRIFSWNYAGEDYSSVHYPAAAAPDFHVFAEREPLQSSYARINSNYPQFQGIGFSDQELPNFRAAAAMFKDDEIPVLSMSSSTASFLHYGE